MIVDSVLLVTFFGMNVTDNVTIYVTDNVTSLSLVMSLKKRIVFNENCPFYRYFLILEAKFFYIGSATKCLCVFVWQH